MRFHASKLSAKGYLDPEKHGVDKLRDVIERRIIANKATNIIDSHQARLDSVFERAERRLQTVAESLRSYLDVVDASAEERARQRREAESANLAIHTLLKEARTRFDNTVADEVIKLDGTLDSVWENVSNRAVARLNDVGQIEQLAPYARWTVQKELYKQRTQIAKGIVRVTREIEGFLTDEETTLSEELHKHSLGARVTRHHLLPLSPRTICKAAEGSLTDALNSVLLSEIVEKATTWWQRWWDTRKGRDEGVEALNPKLDESLQKAFENISEHTRREMDKHGKEALSSMADSIREINEGIEKTLDDLENADQRHGSRREQISDQLDATGDEIREIGELYAEFRESVGG